MISRQGHLKLIFSNQENHAATFVSVLPAVPEGWEQSRTGRLPSLRRPILSSPLLPRGRGFQLWRLHLEGGDATRERQPSETSDHRERRPQSRHPASHRQLPEVMFWQQGEPRWLRLVLLAICEKANPADV